MNDIEIAIEELKHCKEIGNIIFQIPEDEEIIDTIIQTLEKQMPKKPKIMNATLAGEKFWWYCGHCGASRHTNSRSNYCSYCGGKTDWK